MQVSEEKAPGSPILLEIPNASDREEVFAKKTGANYKRDRYEEVEKADYTDAMETGGTGYSELDYRTGMDTSA